MFGQRRQHLVTLVTLFTLTYAVPFKDNYHDISDIVNPELKIKSHQAAAFQLDHENDMQYWLTKAKDTLKEKLEIKEKKMTAKNVILFLGDGMSIPTLTASRIFLGQQSNNPGEETVLSFEKFPFVGLSKPYCVDRQVADSACSSTAYLNGVKGNIKTIGVTSSVKLRDCDAMNNPNHHTSSIGVWAQAAGKATGLVTTARVTHASPAGLYAHTAHRDWEDDSSITDDGFDSNKCMDITKQLVTQNPGKNLKVILGGGRATFMPDTERDPEYKNKTGNRKDGRNFINEWLEDKKKQNFKAKYVWNRDDMLNAEDSDCILGLFEDSHMKYHLKADPKTEPTLEEMTKLAINILKKENKGYFLFVEGGKIDMAHHQTRAKMALDETIEFAKAIQAAHEITNEDDTLIVVTADHAHTMSFSGYPIRGSDILTNIEKSKSDSLPYSTLNYANGPGYKQSINGTSSRYDISKDIRDDVDYRFPAITPLDSETHGGDDVAVFARGPWAHLLTGSFEQNYIAVVMGYAAGIGPAGDISSQKSASSSSHPELTYFIIVSTLLFKLC